MAGVLVVGIIGWFILEPSISRAIRLRNRNNPTVQEAISRYVRLGVVVLAILVGFGPAGYGEIVANSTPVIAAGTLALGVAGQTVIGSIISGLVLVLDPEFNIGNYMEWKTGEGTVQSVTLRVTRVHPLDGALVTIQHPADRTGDQTAIRPGPLSHGRARRALI